MRVTTNSMMSNLMNQVGNVMSKYQQINEQVSTEKRINRLSDDPAGLATAIKHRGNSTAYEQYEMNIRDAESYLRATDSAINQLQIAIDRAREIAETVATETANEIEKQVAAEQLQEIINEIIGLANSKMGDRYIFAGTLGEKPAYSLEGRILDPLASTLNTYNDKVEVGGEYNGVGEFIVKFTKAGDVGEPGMENTAMYQISSDGGLTWSDEKYFTNLTMHITDSEGNDTGLTMTYMAEPFGEGDEFRLQVVSGKYIGDDGHIEFNNNLFSRVNTNVNGKELFEDTGLFDTLYQLKNAITHGNNLEISEALKSLDSIQTGMQPLVVTTGQAMSRLEITKSNLMLLRENVYESIQDIEKIDYVKVLTDFAMIENALNASVAALAKVFPTGLINII